MKAGPFDIPMDQIVGPVRSIPSLPGDTAAESVNITELAAYTADLSRAANIKALMSMLERDMSQAVALFVKARTLEDFLSAQAIARVVAKIHERIATAVEQAPKLNEKAKRLRN